MGNGSSDEKSSQWLNTSNRNIWNFNFYQVFCIHDVFLYGFVKKKNIHIQHVVYQNALQVAKKTYAFSVTGRNMISFFFTFTDIFWPTSIYHPLQLDNFNVTQTNKKIQFHLCIINFISNLYTKTRQVRFQILVN